MRRLITAGICALLLAGCGGSQGTPTHTSDPAQKAEKSQTTSSAPQPQGPAPVEGISEEDTAEAKKIVEQMSDEELAGSVLMMTYHGTDPKVAADTIKRLHLSGSIVMTYNLGETATLKDLQATTSAIKAGGKDRDWPVLTSVDQEGGPVARVRSATMPFPPLMAGGAVRNKDTVTNATHAQGAELRDAGFSIDFAPVADVTVGAKDPAINVRSAGDKPGLVSDTVAAAVNGYSQAGIGSAAKHFPGHGSLTVDSHESLPVSKKSLKKLGKTEFEPFRKAAEVGVPMVMVGHIALPGNEKLPADLNPEVYEALRKDVGFEHVAVTDALNMGAITQKDAALTAIKAGADLALMPNDIEHAHASIVKAVKSGDLPRQRLTEAAARVVSLSLWHKRSAETTMGSAPKTEDALSAYAEESLSVVSGECKVAKPLKRARVIGDDQVAVKRLTEAFKNNGVSVGDGPTVSVGQKPADGAKYVVGIGAPWNVDRAKADTVIATYSGNEYAMDAAAKYMAGTLEAKAQVPVKVRAKSPVCGK